MNYMSKEEINTYRRTENLSKTQTLYYVSGRSVQLSQPELRNIKKLEKINSQRNLPTLHNFYLSNLNNKIKKMTSKSMRNRVKSDLIKAKEFAQMKQEKVKVRKVHDSVGVSARISLKRKSEIVNFLKRKSQAELEKTKNKDGRRVPIQDLDIENEPISFREKRSDFLRVFFI